MLNDLEDYFLTEHHFIICEVAYEIEFNFLQCHNMFTSLNDELYDNLSPKNVNVFYSIYRKH